MRRSLISHCEVAARFGARLGLEPAVVEALGHGFERWDGTGLPVGLADEAIPLAVRIAVVARDADLLWRSAPDELTTVLQARRGRAYDPAVVDAFGACGRDLLVEVDGCDPWSAAVTDPGDRVLAGEEVDTALRAVGDFADLKSPWTRGRSGHVAELAVEAGGALGTSAGDLDLLRRAALVADVGRVGVPNGVWDRRGPLGIADWERVRLHPYLTERILTRCPSLAAVGRLAAAHHERLDGSGYHRGIKAQGLDDATRLLAVADAVAAMGESRPHRPALSPAAIIGEVGQGVSNKWFDATCAAAVLAAAGHRPSPGRRRSANPLATRPPGFSARTTDTPPGSPGANRTSLTAVEVRAVHADQATRWRVRYPSPCRGSSSPASVRFSVSAGRYSQRRASGRRTPAWLGLWPPRNLSGRSHAAVNAPFPPLLPPQTPQRSGSEVIA
jgi:HD-GYP domain-containing protein (c-di-GMP phosphodiesterase class II)